MGYGFSLLPHQTTISPELRVLARMLVRAQCRFHIITSTALCFVCQGGIHRIRAKTHEYDVRSDLPPSECPHQLSTDGEAPPRNLTSVDGTEHSFYYNALPLCISQAAART